MDAQSETSEARNHELEEIMERINKYTDGPEDTGVEFIKGGSTKEEKAVNEVFDGLMMTLQNIGEDSMVLVEKHGANSNEYESVLRALEPLILAASSTADDEVPFRRNTRAEEKFREREDEVEIFTAGDIELQGTAYDIVSVFIRPKKYIRPSSIPPKVSNPERPRLNEVFETRQPRMTFKAIPRDNPSGYVEIRLDREQRISEVFTPSEKRIFADFKP